MPDLPAERARYEEEVRALREVGEALRTLGWTEERMARHLVAARNGLKTLYRTGLPRTVLTAIEQRNRARYGDPVGPSADQLLQRYGSWQAVMEAACRPASLSNRPR